MFFYLISQSPRMFHLYLSISCVSFWSFPATLSVLVFHVPMVILSLPPTFDDAPVAYLTPLSWCTAEGVVTVDPGGDRSSMVWLLVFIIWRVTGKVHPNGAHSSPGRTRGRWVHRGILPPIWPLSSTYEDICPVISPTLFYIYLERIMTDALEDHEGTVIIEGRTITNLPFKWHWWFSRRGGCREDQTDDKQHQWHQHRD